MRSSEDLEEVESTLGAVFEECWKSDGRVKITQV
jgi:hypothetical protein